MSRTRRGYFIPERTIKARKEMEQCRKRANRCHENFVVTTLSILLTDTIISNLSNNNDDTTNNIFFIDIITLASLFLFSKLGLKPTIIVLIIVGIVAFLVKLVEKIVKNGLSFSFDKYTIGYNLFIIKSSIKEICRKVFAKKTIVRVLIVIALTSIFNYGKNVVTSFDKEEHKINYKVEDCVDYGVHYNKVD